ncbi:MAG: NAD-dependent epimerase/dehydratase family protein [Proteobacteria bacterium]|nr:NAD-dependent epimerase/dehydratase family protein [Pseudomonadota bacterium]
MLIKNLCEGQKSNILILGGTGFIGTWLAEHFCDAGHKVYSLARNPPKTSYENRFYFYVEGNINNGRLLEPLVEECPVIIHAAADSVPGDTIKAPLFEAYNNLLPTVALIETLQNFENRHIFFISSGGAIYGNPETNPVSETSPCNPISYHGACKLSLENFLFPFAYQTNNKVTIIRPSNVYGPGQRNKNGFGLIQTILSAILIDSEFYIWGDGSIVKDYLHIRDFVIACEKILLSANQEKYVRYNVGYGKGYSINAICQIAEEITGKKIRKVHKEARIIDPAEIILNTDKIRTETGWCPDIDLKEGISQVWKSLKTVMPKS